MGTITSEMKKFLDKQKLGFVATVSEDNTPNLSPKGSITSWDDENLVFADIRSPQTIENIKKNPVVEINSIDPLLRKGYRFKGKASILTGGSEYFEMLAHFKRHGIKSKINSVVLVKIESADSITSPIYDLGYTEKEIKEKWKNYYLSS